MNSVLTIQQQQVPALGLGTYQLTGKEGEDAVTLAASLGYRHIDTAQYYQNEDIVGNAIRRSGRERKEFFVTTKIWPTEFTRAKFNPSVERSLRKLNMDYVDLLLLHWPSDDSYTNDLAAELLYECHTKGYARRVGVSNFNLAQLKKVQTHASIFCNQVEYNPYTNPREMVTYAQQQNMLLTAYTPLARGRVNKDATLLQLAEKYGKTPSQITLAWLLQQKNISPIPKAGSEKHLRENMDASDIKLSEEDMELLFAISK
jgi:2,5-diketo-D-gluconate reductase B